MTKKESVSVVALKGEDLLKTVKTRIATMLLGERASNAECVSCHEVPTGFKDALSAKDWTITNLCQVCQDDIYRDPEEDEDSDDSDE